MAEGDAEVIARIDRMLDELMVSHLEMASLCGEYRELLDRVLEAPWDKDSRRMAHAMPGAKYHVASTFANDLAKRIAAELSLNLAEGA